MFNDYRYVDEPKEGKPSTVDQNYDYQFVFPENFKPTPAGLRDEPPGELLVGEPKVYRIAANGDFVQLNRQDGVDASYRNIYTKFPAVAFLGTGYWVRDPSIKNDASPWPIVIVEPLEPTTFESEKISNDPDALNE